MSLNPDMTHQKLIVIQKQISSYLVKYNFQKLDEYRLWILNWASNPSKFEIGFNTWSDWLCLKDEELNKLARTSLNMPNNMSLVTESIWKVNYWYAGCP